MTESEPSAPLPFPTPIYMSALTAAIERAERAERGRDDLKGLAATAADWLQSTRRDLDQARAQLAKVRAIHHPVWVSSGGSSTTDREGNHRSTVTWATACSCTHNWEVRCATLAALDPVGVVGPWRETP